MPGGPFGPFSKPEERTRNRVACLSGLTRKTPLHTVASRLMHLSWVVPVFLTGQIGTSHVVSRDSHNLNNSDSSNSELFIL